MKTILLLTSGILCCHFVFAQSYSYTTIKTPTNSTINALLYSELSPTDLATIESNAAGWISSHGSNATRVAAATITYNCHGYAWHVKDGGSAVWINAHSDTDDDPEELSPYWSGSSPTYTSATSADATVAFYGSCWSYNGTNYVNDCDHSAKVISPSLFESKWGAWPRYQHAPTDCPYPSSNIQYYKIPLTGANTVCSSGSTYSTLNISGASYSWSGSNVSISGSSYSVTGSATSSGTTGYVQVNIASSYSGTTVLAKKALTVGTPVIINPNYWLFDASSNMWQFSQSSQSPSVTYTFYVASGSASLSQNYQDCYITTSGGADVCVYGTNSCGAGTAYCFSIPAGGGSYMRAVSPNPTKDQLSLYFKDTKSLETLPSDIYLYAENSTKAVRSIAIKEVYEQKAFEDGDKLNVSVGDLPRGIYYLHIVSNQESKQPTQRVRIILE